MRFSTSERSQTNRNLVQLKWNIVRARPLTSGLQLLFKKNKKKKRRAARRVSDSVTRHSGRMLAIAAAHGNAVPGVCSRIFFVAERSLSEYLRA